MTPRRILPTLGLLVAFLAALALPALTPVTASSPYAVDDSYTVALLHCDGANNSTTFTDESGKTWTPSGNAVISTAQSVFGGASCFLDGNGDYLTASDSADWAFGTGAFTIDFRVRFRSLPASGTQYTLTNQEADGNNRIKLSVLNNAGTYQLLFRVFSGGSLVIDITQNASLAINTWYHVALVRSGNSWYWFVNGTQAGTTITDADSVPDLAASYAIGHRTLAEYLDGYLDEFRVSKGVARWTANFTPPGSDYQPTPTPTNTATFTATNTATATNTPTSTATFTPTNTATATNTATNTPGPTATNTATNTPGPTSTNTSAPTATDTPTSTATDTATATTAPTITPTQTPATPVVPTWYIVNEITYGEYAVNVALLGLCSVVILVFFVLFVLLLNRRKK